LQREKSVGSANWAHNPDRFPESKAGRQNPSFINKEKLTAKIAESAKMGSILLIAILA